MIKANKIVNPKIIRTSIAKFILIAFVLSSVGCTRSILDKKNQIQPFSIPPRVPKREIVINPNISFLPNTTDERVLLLKNTEDLFSFLNTMIDMGTEHDNEDLIELGNRLTERFYANREHYSAYGPNRTPYAYLFFEEDAKKNNEILDYTKDMVSRLAAKIKYAISNMEIIQFTKISNFDDYDLERYFDAIINFVGRIEDELEKDDLIGEPIIEAVGGIIESEYIPVIRKLKTDLLSDVNIGHTFEKNIENVKEIINKNELIQNTELGQQILEDIEEAIEPTAWRKFLAGASRIFGRDMPNEQLLINLANFFVDNLHTVPEILSDIFEQEINKLLNNEEDFKEAIHLVIGSMFDDLAFNRGVAPAIEFSNVETYLDHDNNVVFDKPLISKHKKVTTANTWALSMPLMLERLKFLEESRDNPFDEKYKQILFSLINKSSSSVGYAKDEENLDVYKGSFLPFDNTDNVANSRIDIRTYYDNKNPTYFGMPETLTISNGFEIDFENTNTPDMKTTVLSQAEYIDGVTEILEFFRTDRGPNSFDIAIGNENINNLKIFPKDSLFLLNLGLMSVVFTNLKKKGVLLYDGKGAILYDETGEHVLTFDDIKDEHDIRMMSVSDVTNDIQHNKIVTKDISKFIISIDNLLRFMNSINVDNLDVGGGVRNVFSDPIFLNSKELIRQMILGLGFLLTSKLQQPEGGFYDSYYLDTNFGKNTLSLDTQVHAIRGLVAMHNHEWESNLIKLVITDTYRTMNNKLFDEDLGFYKINENQKILPDLRLTMDTLQMLYELDEILYEEDLENLRHTREYWAERLVEQLSELN